MIISTIVAMGNNREIGKDNDIPWYLPADLKYFKKRTLDRHIIMGRKCFESIGRPLPKRTNVIVTRNPYYIISNALVTHSLPEALEIAHENGEEEVFIIGGGVIYDLSKDLWDKMYITEVDIDIPDATVHFPEMNYEEWNLTEEVAHKADEKNKYDYVFKTFERIKGSET